MPMDGIAMQTWEPTARAAPAPTPRGQPLRGLQDMALDTEMQMTSLLRPFAQHVRDLQSSVSELLDRLQRSDARMDMQDKRLADQTMWGQQLKSSVDPLKSHMVALQNGLTQLNREKTMLEQDHEETKAAVQALAARLDGTDGLGQQLRGDLDAQGASIEQLRGSLQDVQQNISGNIEPSIEQHGQDLGHLHSRLLNVDKDLQERGKTLDEHLQTFKDFKKAYTQQVAEDQRSVHNLTQQVKRVRGLVDDSDGRIAAQREELNDTTEELRKLRSQHERLDGQVVVLKDRADKVSKEILSIQARLPPVEKGIHQLLEAANVRVRDAQDDLNRKRTINEFLHDLEDSVLEHAAFIKELKASEAERNAQAVKVVEGVQKQIHKLNDQVGIVNKDVKDLHGLHGTSRELIDNSMSLHTEHRGEFSSNDQKVGHIRSEVNSLQLQLRDATDSIAKLYASLDLCHDYMSGMRKGFRDANTRVVGTDDPLLPDPGAAQRPRSMTPVLPTMRMKSATPSTAFNSCRESPAPVSSPGVLGSARADSTNPASPPPFGPNRGGLANTASHGDGRGHRVVSR